MTFQNKKTNFYTTFLYRFSIKLEDFSELILRLSINYRRKNTLKNKSITGYCQQQNAISRNPKSHVTRQSKGLIPICI